MNKKVKSVVAVVMTISCLAGLTIGVSASSKTDTYYFASGGATGYGTVNFKPTHSYVNASVTDITLSGYPHNVWPVGMTVSTALYDTSHHRKSDYALCTVRNQVNSVHVTGSQNVNYKMGAQNDFGTGGHVSTTWAQ